MRFQLAPACVLIGLVAGLGGGGGVPVPGRCLGAESPEAEAEIAVTDTFDGKPFSYRVTSVTARSGFSVHYLAYPSPVVSDLPQNNTIPAEFYLPDGYERWTSPRPAVICMHILDGDFQLERMTCSMLASRGIPALMFKLPYYGERSPKEGTRALARQPARFAAALAQSKLEIRRTVDLLASRPELDGEHLGITGISLGAIVAATGAAEEPRLRRAFLILGGGDLPKIIGHAEETAGLSQMIRALPADEQRAVDEALRQVDPLTHAAKLRELAEQGRVVMVNAAEDDVVPRECTERLAAELGIADKVVWLEGLGHYTAIAAMPQTLERMVAFFAQDLAGDVQLSMERKPPTSEQIALELIQRAATILADRPEEGRCHVADVSVAVSSQSNKDAFSVDAFFARDGEGRFKLDAKTEQFGHLALGGGSDLWFLAKGILFRGSEPASPPEEPVALIGESDLTKIRTVGGALKAATMAPGIFEQLFIVTQGTGEDGRALIDVARKDGSPERLRLVLDGDRKTVGQMQVEWRDGRATVQIRAFQANAPAHEGLFRPVAAERTQEVSGADLARIFRSVVDFAMQRLAN
ncbi:MAG: alpha/beta hydrolase family protein [Thermoguttaceae bacterium]